MFVVRSRIYRKAADGRTVLLYTPGTKLNDEQARRAGLVPGAALAEPPARGLTILPERERDPQDPPPDKPLDRMKLDELRDVCGAEDIDPGDAITRAEYIAAIEAARLANVGDGQGED